MQIDLCYDTTCPWCCIGKRHLQLALAPDSAREAVIDAVYAAYFEQGRDIGDLEVLVDLAGAAGLERDALHALLQGDAAQEQVQSEARWAQQAGVSGVPFYIVDSQYAWSGAQPPEAILQMLSQIEAKHP